jgi:hypothetical protein
MKIILPASDIPLGSIVTKRTGEKQYTIRNKIRIFNENGIEKEITSNDGTRFLVNKNGDANVINSNTELVWYTDKSTLINFLECDE